MELWGGPECTVNRTGDVFRDQSHLSGHHDRIEDLALIADLGVRKLRYPVLWERVAPDHPDRRDWRWSDERLAEIARLGMEPVVGLLHHGSGPRYTSLVDDNFIALFANHAAAVARRYPHVTRWTPVNEPLTTARFSALYGHWYPHARDERAFWTALLNQVDGTRAAMAAIRRVRPDAQLVQTEDLGEVHATPSLAGHADYLNHRRWLGWDLLTGRVGRDHFFWAEAAALGFADRLRRIADDPCPPDIIGVNHYPTSERFLDDRPGDEPMPAVGYHDREALRVLDPPAAGLGGLLRQAWDRYRLPLAVTECHLGCTRDEQMRWLWQAWRHCRSLADEGVDLRALTVWALFGGTDWNSLLTVDAGHYEPGVFDVRGGTPRPTALARLMAMLGEGEETVAPEHPLHPVLSGPGWWRRDLRLEHASFPGPGGRVIAAEPVPTKSILITGGDDALAQAFAGACRLRGLSHLVVERASPTAGDAEQIARTLDLYQPWAVIDAAGWADAASAKHTPVLAAACAARELHCTVFSVDDPTRVPEAVVVRAGLLFSPYDESNFAIEVERALDAGRPFAASPDAVVVPSFTPDLVRACLDLAIDGARGIWRMTSGAATNRFDLARRIADALGLDPSLVVPVMGESSGREPDGADAGLPDLDDALDRHVAVRRRRVIAAEPALC